MPERRIAGMAGGLSVLLLLTAFASDNQGAEFGGRIELGVFIPHMSFDDDARVADRQGLDDGIEDAFGQGVSAAYNFNRRHALEVDTAWLNSKGEDQRGRNFFVIQTRYHTIAYRRQWWLTDRYVPFLNAGVGSFYARARETNHPNDGGGALLVGGGLRYFVDRRSSVRVYVQHSEIDLNTAHTVNRLVMFGASWHLGRF